jgi:hypothetical protein
MSANDAEPKSEATSNSALLPLVRDLFHVVARLREGDALYPVNRIDIRVARIAELFHPLLNAAASGVVSGKDIGAAHGSAGCYAARVCWRPHHP